MPTEADKQLQLHRDLKEFYNERADYFAEAHEVNWQLTPERSHLLSWIRRGTRVLDVGCGPGDNGRYLSSRTRYFGCDLSSVALNMAREALPECRFALCESQALPFASSSFDVVLSTYSLEHFVFARQSLEEMWRICRPDGLVVLISPAYDDPRQLPPSTSHWTALQRVRLRLGQTWRQFVRHVMPERFYFTCITQPRVLSGVFESDFDAVHLVSAREIANFFKAKGAKILFERKRMPRPVAGDSFLIRCREHCRNLCLRLHLAEYAGLNLQIVAARGEPGLGHRADQD